MTEGSTLPIQKGIPMPEQASLRRGVIRETLTAMAVGDSFVVKKTSFAAVYDNAKRLNIGVRIVRMGDGMTGRVWRLP